jgi:FkbM family methyltransferase
MINSQQATRKLVFLDRFDILAEKKSVIDCQTEKCCLRPELMGMNIYRKIRNNLKLNKRNRKRLARLEKCGNFKINEIDGVKIVEVNDLNLGHIFDGDGVLIAEEIFNNDEYDFDIGVPAVVIDIGMNIGLASLYFAARDDIKRVYGFEPFKPTFEHAMFNFNINKKYSNKILPHNYGLGNQDKELSFEYYSKAPGRMSTVKLIDQIPHNPKYGTRNETVQIKDAAKEISAIIEQHNDSKIVIKCDTEGSEKEIFESLDAKGILENIDIVMLEYHFSYDMGIVDILKRNGFVIFKQKTVSLDTGNFGMIRAVKKT